MRAAFLTAAMTMLVATASTADAQRRRAPAAPARITLPLRLGVYVLTEAPCNTDVRNNRLFLTATSAGRYVRSNFVRITPMGGNRFRVLERSDINGDETTLWTVASQTQFSWQSITYAGDQPMHYRWCAAR